MPRRGGANNIRSHTCADGQVRRVEPVYLREESEPGKRIFKRVGWFCYVCRYSDGAWSPDSALTTPRIGNLT